MAAQNDPRASPVSLQILRRRVIEEMRKPGPDGTPLFQSDAQLARFVGLTGAQMSLFLRKQKRGVSWKIVDRLAKALNVEIWKLFWVAPDPYEWKSR